MTVLVKNCSNCKFLWECIDEYDRLYTHIREERKCETAAKEQLNGKNLNEICCPKYIWVNEEERND